MAPIGNPASTIPIATQPIATALVAGPLVPRRAMLALFLLGKQLTAQPGDRPLLLLRTSDLQLLRKAFASPGGPLARERAALETEAAAYLTKGPWSVTSARPSNTPTKPNDYFSEGPYWWPDPANPSGPYLRRDGEVNPNRFTQNHEDLRQLCESVLCLATAAALLDDQRYASHAWHLLRVWFVDEDTRMNPNLEFGQAIRGRLWGRGIGLIDTRNLIWLVQGLALLEATAPADPVIQNGMRTWFRDFLRWMTTSEKGVDERDHGTNHSTWWAAQVAAYATWLNDEASVLRAWTFFYEQIIPKQFLPNGSAPKEEERTRSLSYSAMNLDGVAILCRIGQLWGLDLWEHEAENGSSPAKAVDYVLPFLEAPQKWTKAQIVPVQPSRHFFPALAGWGLDKPEYVEAQQRLGCEGSEICRWVRMLVALPPMANRD